MRKNIAKVIEAFKQGKAANGDSKCTCWTNGTQVFSYNMLIARRRGPGLKSPVSIVAYEDSPSVTTSSQIHALEEAFPNAPRFRSGT